MIDPIIKSDLFDLAKVNIPSVSAIIAVKNQTIDFLLNGGAENLLIVVILLLIAIYNFYKLIKMRREMKWAKEDRENESG